MLGGALHNRRRLPEEWRECGCERPGIEDARAKPGAIDGGGVRDRRTTR
jgi:hypothetical protein